MHTNAIEGGVVADGAAWEGHGAGTYKVHVKMPQVSVLIAHWGGSGSAAGVGGGDSRKDFAA